MTALNLNSWSNTVRAAMTPSKARVMIGKVVKRFTDDRGLLSKEQNLAWLKSHAGDLEVILKFIDPEIARETQEFMAHIAAHSAKILRDIPYDLGGGGGVPLLYALTRLRKPKVVVETGVAAGFSSATILAAMEKNGGGHLYSSDFPYFRIPNPERFVGVIVEERLKSRWSLFLKGDEINLPEIASKLPAPADIFHYDSDKSYTGRKQAMETMAPMMEDGSVIIMDDIQDNSHFHDFVVKSKAPWSVYAYEGKYIGVIGKAF